MFLGDLSWECNSNGLAQTQIWNLPVAQDQRDCRTPFDRAARASRTIRRPRSIGNGQLERLSYG